MSVDQRFYTFKGPQSLRALSRVCGFEVSDDCVDKEVQGIAAAADAGQGDLCFVEGGADKAFKVSKKATACLVTKAAAPSLQDEVVPLIVERPRWSHILASHQLFELKSWQCDGSNPDIHKSVTIGPGVFVGAGAAVGEDVEIGPGTIIGPGVQIGRGTKIGANVSIRCALIGDHVNILSGARIGESGFGVTIGPSGAEDVPQWGRVIIQDHVTIGANTCIDRGAFADTIIGERTRIDNLCQIAHNVVIGRNVMIASFAGISGSTVIGDGVVMGGRVGIADHVNIGAGAQLAASAGIFRDIPAGEAWGGTPAKPLRQYLRETAWLQRQIAPRKKPE